MKPSRNTPGPHRRGPSGESVKADELLPLSALHTRLGWGARGLAAARRQGLRVLRFGRWHYVLGRDLIEFLESVQTVAERQPPGGISQRTKDGDGAFDISSEILDQDRHCDPTGPGERQEEDNEVGRALAEGVMRGVGRPSQ
jgi:hypothetical protein